MMNLPLNCAILKYFTKVDTPSSADDVIDALKADYGDFKAFKKKEVMNVLLTGVVNGFLQEERYELDKGGNVTIWYKANQEGRDLINHYLPD